MPATLELEKPKTTSNTPVTKECLLGACLEDVERERASREEAEPYQDGARLPTSYATLAPGHAQAYNHDLPLVEQDVYCNPNGSSLPAEAVPAYLGHERELLVQPAQDFDSRSPALLTQPSSEAQGSALSQLMDDLALRNVFMYPAHNFALRQHSAQQRRAN